MNVDTQKTLEMLKGSLNPNKLSEDNLRKTVTTATGLTYYDLQAPAKNLYPILTPLRNALPRVGRPGERYGTATNWKVVSAITGSGYDAMGWVPEGQRSGVMSYTVENKAATYVTIGEEDAITFEAEAAAVGFEDENAMVTFRLLQKMMYKEEIGLLAGNASVALGTPGTITKSASGTGATLPTATYYIQVIALTMEGYMNSSIANGVATSKTVTGADGQTYVLNGGSSAPSAEVSQAITLGEGLNASIPLITGAVAYAWYIGTSSGGERLEFITTINSIRVTAPLAGTGQVITGISGDHSRNASLAFDGLLATVFNNTSTAYFAQLATGTAGTGTVLTASGRGSVTQIDTALKAMWDSRRLGPDIIYVSSQELKNITTKCLTNDSGPLLRYDINGAGTEPYGITANGVVKFYYNPYTGKKVPVECHPYLAPGTIFLWCQTLPPQYQSNEVPAVAQVITRRDYYRIDWPLVTRKRQFGVYAEEVLAVYAPFALGVITNIADG